MQESESQFKVVDRRRFTDEGEARSDAEDVVASQPMAEPEFQADSDEPEHGPMSFSIFIQTLAQQALLAMGLIAWPDSGKTEVRLDHARETIDVLAMLYEKTNGNLTPDEQRLFETILYELRLTFVDLLQGGKSGA
jgi:hypothetical protein